MTTDEDSSAVPPVQERWAKTPPGRRRDLLIDFIRGEATSILELDPSQTIDPRQSLGDFAFDSVMAVELSNALAQGTGLELPATLLFDSPTIDDLADYLATGLDAQTGGPSGA